MPSWKVFLPLCILIRNDIELQASLTLEPKSGLQASCLCCPTRPNRAVLRNLFPIPPPTLKKWRQCVGPYLWVAVHANRTTHGTRRPCGKGNKKSEKETHPLISRYIDIYWYIKCQVIIWLHRTAMMMHYIWRSLHSFNSLNSLLLISSSGLLYLGETTWFPSTKMGERCS